MMRHIFVDTDILIDFSKGFKDTLSDLFSQQTDKLVSLYVNPIVIAEFMTDHTLTITTMQKEARDFLSYFSCLPVSAHIGYVTGELLREKQVISLGDALIAATCLQHDLYLATRNKKDFSSVPRIKLL